MNCPNCNAPLSAHARFCTKCGQPVAPQSHEPPTLPFSQPQDPPQPQPLQQPSQAMRDPSQAPQAQPTYYPDPAVETHSLARPENMPSRPRKRRGSCLVGALLTFVVVVLLLAAVWFFGLRPYLHATAQDQIDRAFSQAVQQMPPQLSLAPPGPVTLTDNMFNNLIQLNMPPDSVVKQVAAHITSSEIRIDFQVYGMPCDITGVPQVSNNHLVATNVHVDGIIGLIISSDEMTATLNKHLADAQARLNHSVQAVVLEDQKMILTLGPANGIVPPLP